MTEELNTHLCGWCKDRSAEEREAMSVVHAGQCWPCREERCPLFGKQIAVGIFGKHEESHKELQVAPVPAVVETSVETSTGEASAHCNCKEHHPDFADRGGDCATGQSVDCTQDPSR